MDKWMINQLEVPAEAMPGAEALLLWPEEGMNEERIRQEAALIRTLTDRSFVLACYPVKDWNRELSPWEAPPVFGKEAFGSGAAGTFQSIIGEVLPAIRDRYGLSAAIPAIIGGYSLAGLFALWCGYRTDVFRSVAAASPSVWFPGWKEFTETQPFLAEAAYLSLGDREERTRNPLMSTVGEAIRRQEQNLNLAGIPCVLEWNPGNHFREPELRLAKGFAWCLGRLPAER